MSLTLQSRASGRELKDGTFSKVVVRGSRSLLDWCIVWLHPCETVLWILSKTCERLAAWVQKTFRTLSRPLLGVFHAQAFQACLIANLVDRTKHLHRGFCRKIQKIAEIPLKILLRSLSQASCSRGLRLATPPALYRSLLGPFGPETPKSLRLSGASKPGFPKAAFPLFTFLVFSSVSGTCSCQLQTRTPQSHCLLQFDRKPQPASVTHVMWPNSIRAKKRNKNGKNAKKRKKGKYGDLGGTKNG